jgi:hypothetical protein
MVKVSTQQKQAIQVNSVLSAQFTQFSRFGALMSESDLALKIIEVEEFLSFSTVTHTP